MDVQVAKPKAPTRFGLYLPSLDGLRFAAFLLVFVHHFPPLPYPFMATLHERGWVGVEIFFAISACLFFRLFAAEAEKTGALDVLQFYVRRLLRLYPLMVAFPLLMIAVYGAGKSGWGRLLGLASFSDNFLSAVRWYNAIPFAGHLWTLSYEFQIYAVIPLAFIIYRAGGTRRFLMLLGVIWAVSLAARGAFVAMAIPHPAIWVLPFLRPESTLAGLLISIGVFNRVPPSLALGATIAGAAAIIALPDVEVIGWSTMLLYPACAMFAGGLVSLLLTQRHVGAFFAAPPLRALGRISFGLYVYHLLAIDLAQRFLVDIASPLAFPVALALTIAMATVSYFVLERPFLMLKRRFTLVAGAPI